MNFLEWWESYRCLGFSRASAKLAEEAYNAGYREGMARTLEVMRDQAIEGHAALYDVERVLHRESRCGDILRDQKRRKAAPVIAKCRTKSATN